MKQQSIKLRILIPLLLGLSGLLAAFLVSFYEAKERDFRDKTQFFINLAEDIFKEELRHNARIMLSALETLVGDKTPVNTDELRTAWLKKDREALLRITTPFFEKLRAQHGVTHLYFTGPDRVNFLRVHHPDKHGDLINRQTMLNAEKSGSPASGIELGPLATFTLRQVVPWRFEGRLLGYIELGMEIEAALKHLAETINVDIVLAMRKEYLERQIWEKGMRHLGRNANWDRFPSTAIVAQTLPVLPGELNEWLDREDFHQEYPPILEVNLNGHAYHAASFHIKDAGSKEVGHMFILFDITGERSEVRAFLLKTSAVFAVIVGLMGIFLYLFLGRIDRRLQTSHRELARERQELQESEDRFRSIASTAYDALIMMDHEGYISFWNKAAEKIFGYTSAEAVGKDLHELLVPVRYLEAFRKGFSPFKKTGEGAAIGKVLQVEGIKKNGEEFPVELAVSAVKIKDKWCAVGIVRDITRRKQAEEALQQTHEDLEGRVQERTEELNQANKALVNEIEERKKAEEELKKAMDNLIWAQKELEENLRDKEDSEIAAFNMVEDLEESKKNLERTQKELEESLEEADRSEAAALNMMDDIEESKTEQKNLILKLAKANEEIKSFANIVSHDLRSPLVNMKGFSNELKDACGELKEILEKVAGQLADRPRKRMEELLQVDIAESLDFIGSSTSTMDRLISHILSLSRIGRRKLHKEKIETAKLVEEKIKSFHHQIKSKGIKVTARELPPVMADESAMEQIFGNILSNAINYLIPDRPGIIDISGETRDNRIIFRIKDNGRGIMEEDRHKVFEIFRRAGKQDVPGEGMGMSYVKILVERHDGEICFESEEGIGTTFLFTIPK